MIAAKSVLELRRDFDEVVAGAPLLVQRAGFATLLFDLLTPDEAVEDEVTAELRFDADLLTSRVLAAARWVTALPRTRELRLGYFGASTGAAATLVAAAERPELVAAAVSRISSSRSPTHSDRGRLLHAIARAFRRRRGR